MKILLLAFVLAPLACQAETIYLCKRSNGETFWTAGDCTQNHALRRAIVSVPDGLTFDQQIRFAEQRSHPAECQTIAARVANLEARAGQAKSAQGQARIRAEQEKARNRQSALRCR